VVGESNESSGGGSVEMSYQNALSIIDLLGDDGVSWYCGLIDNITDLQDNVYDVADRAEMQATLGHFDRIFSTLNQG
jgi:hypothetical protein